LSDLNDKQAAQFNTEIGQKASINRETDKSEVALYANRKLRELGDEINPLPESLRYLGSTAIHIYQTEMLKEIFFVSQTETMQDVHELTASKAFETLRSDLEVTYGRARRVRRSGF